MSSYTSTHNDDVLTDHSIKHLAAFNSSNRKQYYIHQLAFIIRFRYLKKFFGFLRNRWFSMLGMKIGKGTVIPNIYVNWPHKINIGQYCQLEHNIYFKYDNIWQKDASIIIGDNVFIGSSCEFNIRQYISVGSNSLIASGCRFIDHDHGTNLSQLIRIQHGPEASIKIGNDVWLGCNVVVLKGVTIGDGAIIAAGSIVNKSINSYEIWAGVPARKIGERKLA